MRLLGRVLLLALAIPGVAGAGESNCDDGVAWTDGDYITMSDSITGSTIEMRRFTDASQTTSRRKGAVLDKIDLQSGLILVRGADGVKPGDFPMGDVGVVLPLDYLARKFPLPCQVPGEERFSLSEENIMGGPPGQVEGSVRRRGSSILYRFKIKPGAGANSKEFELSGEWRHQANNTPIPKDTDLRGWKVLLPDGSLVAPNLGGKVASIKNLEAGRVGTGLAPTR
jgi:hypothetical protein